MALTSTACTGNSGHASQQGRCPDEARLAGRHARRVPVATVNMWSQRYPLARAGPLLTWSGVFQSRSATVAA